MPGSAERRNKLEVLYQSIMRRPSPLIQPVPILFAFLGPGLLLWLIAFHIPVHYPQETMAPYPPPVAMTPQHAPSVGSRCGARGTPQATSDDRQQAAREPAFLRYQ